VGVGDRQVGVGQPNLVFGRNPGTDVPDSLGFVLKNDETVLDSKLVFGTESGVLGAGA